MNVKLGQYGRTEEGVIFQRVGIADNGYTVIVNGKFTMLSYSDNITKVANTPTELIEVGDLVVLDNELLEVKGFGEYDEFHIGYKCGMLYRVHKDITKILTPNKDKTQYTSQWKKDNND